MHLCVCVYLQKKNFNSYDDPEVKTGDALCYGQYITLQTLPNIGGEVRIIMLHCVYFVLS